jgi:hypothetical protein
VQYQLRIYTIRPGEMAAWVAEWSAHVRPLRERLGFQVIGPWIIDGEDRFVWILAYGGPLAWKEADAAYYGSAERRALDPDPARHIANADQWLMRPPAGRA